MLHNHICHNHIHIIGGTDMLQRLYLRHLIRFSYHTMNSKKQLHQAILKNLMMNMCRLSFVKALKHISPAVLMGYTLILTSGKFIE